MNEEQKWEKKWNDENYYKNYCTYIIRTYELCNVFNTQARKKKPD